jgi:hypothetical protein
MRKDRARGEAAADELVTYLKKLSIQILPVDERKVGFLGQNEMISAAARWPERYAPWTVAG